MVGVFTSNPVNSGGLGFSSLEIGFFFVSWGIYLLPYYTLIWPRLLKWKGKDGKNLRAWYIIRIGLFLDVAFFFLYPFLNFFGNNRAVLWILLELEIMLGVFAVNTYYLALQMITNMSVEGQINGSINGLVTMGLALGKAIAPVTAGLIFSVSEHYHFFPLNYHLLFIVICVAQLGMFALTFIASRLYPSTLYIRIA